VEVVASLSQDRTAAAQCGLFTYKSVPVIFEPPCKICLYCIAGAFTQLRKTPISFVMSASVPPSVRLYGTTRFPPEGFFKMKFYISVFFENLSRKLQFY